MDLKNDHIDKLIIDNEHLIYYVLQKLKLYSKKDDYYDICAIGLIKAAKKFNPNKGYAFSTYAIKIIQNELFQYFRKLNAPKRNPDGNIISLDVILCENLFLVDAIPDDYSMELDLIKKEQLEQLKKNILNLDEEERMIINYYYGIDCTKLTQAQISKIMNISQAQISRIKDRAVSKLKK